MDGKIILNALWISWTLINPGRLLILRNSGKPIRDQSLVMASHINKVTGIIGSVGSFRGTQSRFRLLPSPGGKNPKICLCFTRPRAELGNLSGAVGVTCMFGL